MQQLDPVANANLSFAAALKNFETLLPAEQLSILAFVLRYEVGGTTGADTRRPTSHKCAAAPTNDQPRTESGDSEVLAIQPQRESEQRGAGYLHELAAAANIQLIENYALGRQSENQTSAREKVRKARSVPILYRPASTIAMTMIISFSLTIGTMLWQRKTERLTTREPEMTAIAPTFASPPVPPRLPMLQATPRIEDAPKPNVPTNTHPPHRDTASHMPVRLIFNRSIQQNDPDNPGGMSIAVDGANIQNLSGDSMHITVRVVSATDQRTSQIQVDIEPNSEISVGKEDGLEMQTGDKITLQSAPYPDQVTYVL